MMGRHLLAVVALTGFAVVCECACGNSLSAQDAGSGGDAHGDDAESGSVGDGVCVAPSASSGLCVFCDDKWYCPGNNPPLQQCPNNGVGPCDDDGGFSCFVCTQGVAGSTCSCIHNSSGNYSEEADGAESDAPLTWNCLSTELGCLEQ
jgi:hypothetical protein